MMVLALHGTPSDCSKPTAPVSSVEYTVKANDTLRALSVEFLGTRNRAELAHANNMGTGHGLRAGSAIDVPVHSITEYGLLAQKRQDNEDLAPVRERIVDTIVRHTTRADRRIWTGGNYSCSRLESLWISQGGNPSRAFFAAEIAMAESGGNPSAYSPTNDVGLWQINSSHGSLASFDPASNARAAIRISSNGSDWSPWTTYTSGVYAGRC